MAEEEPLDLAIELFSDAYRHQMKGELNEAAELYRLSIETFPYRGSIHFSRLDL